MADVLGAIRRKYLSFIPKDKSRVDPETGEVFSNLDAERSEQLDGTPVAPPIGYQKQPSMHEIMRQFIASERLARTRRQMALTLQRKPTTLTLAMTTKFVVLPNMNSMPIQSIWRLAPI